MRRSADSSFCATACSLGAVARAADCMLGQLAVLALPVVDEILAFAHQCSQFAGSGRLARRHLRKRGSRLRFDDALGDEEGFLRERPAFVRARFADPVIGLHQEVEHGRARHRMVLDPAGAIGKGRRGIDRRDLLGQRDRALEGGGGLAEFAGDEMRPSDVGERRLDLGRYRAPKRCCKAARTSE